MKLGKMEEKRDKEIKLFEHQEEHVKRIFEILGSNFGYIDISSTGSGKTIATCYVSKQKHIPLLVICPATMCDIWLDAIEDYDVPNIDVLSFNILVGKAGGELKHNYLTRYETLDAKDEYITSYKPTEYLKALIKKGIMIVVDEAQAAKNDSLQNRACGAMIRTLRKMGGRSRYSLLSATLVDKVSCCRNLLTCAGFFDGEPFSYDDNIFRVSPGYEKFLERARKINPEKMEEITEGGRYLRPFSLGDLENAIYKIFIEIYKPVMCCCMPAPNIGYKRIAINGFYKITNEEDADKLEVGVKRLAAALGYDPETDAIRSNMKKKFNGEITNAMVMIEEAKVNDFARVTRDILEKDKMGKVIIMLSYLKGTVPPLLEKLRDFNPVVLTGKLSRKEKKRVREKFQNDDSCQVMIAQIKVGGVGISLQDTIGGRMRYMIISPTYDLIQMHQGAGRIYRVGMKSDCMIIVFFGNVSSMEMRVLHACAIKGGILKEINDRQVRDGMVYPPEYDVYVEGEDKYGIKSSYEKIRNNLKMPEQHFRAVRNRKKEEEMKISIDLLKNMGIPNTVELFQD